MTQVLRESVLDVFSASGVLAQTTEHFQPREGQTHMALAVADAIVQGGSLVVEAGTGVGKTFAYLVPALLSGERVLISTATKTLQDQLFSRDLPSLIKTLNLPIRLALLKGRGSYLCTHRLELARRDVSSSDRHTAHLLSKVEIWSQSTRSGDLAELSGLDERSPLLSLITSNRDNCLGSQCPKFKTCHVNAARREALGADVVVINHHLFFADLAVRESGMAELLPTVRVAVFDEAHQLNETGVQFLGQQISTAQLLDLTRDILATGLQLARGLANWQTVCADLERATRELRLVAGKRTGGVKLRWIEASPEGIAPTAWAQALADLDQACEQAQSALDSVSEIAPDFLRLFERVHAIAAQLEHFKRACNEDSVRWVDVSASQMRLMQAPLDISNTVRQKLLTTTTPRTVPSDVQVDRPRSWIFTSATLGDDERLSWFTEPCGLEGAQVLRVSSPFNYPDQAGVYVPRDVVRPNDAAHSEQVAELAARSAQILGGRTLVLTTTLRALRAIGERMKTALKSHGIEVLIQGELPKRHLMQRFREGAHSAQSGCVLVASASFWEGFDVPGDALQLVVIDKLPFPVPNDPVVEARSKRLELQGRSPFNDYFVPEAVVSLKQGMGRLIRRESDRGLLAICDNRLISTGYGRRLMSAMPAMRRIDHASDWDAALNDLVSTRLSTTAF
jgi:ATP-dependent DNA helicase DinG